MPLDAQEYVRLTPRILAELGASAVAGINAAAAAVTKQATAATAAVVGPDGRLSHLPKSKPVKPYFKRARPGPHPLAVCGVRGPAHLIEHPRKGGYKVRARPVARQA